MPEAILIQEGDKLFFLPYMLRRINDLFPKELEPPEWFDVITPNGYAGILFNEAAANNQGFLQSAMNQLLAVWRSKNICSAFIRLHPILNQGLEKIYSPDICKLTGETVYVDLRVPEDEIWSQTRSDHRKDINRHKRNGLTAKMLPFEQHIDEFNSIYEEVMDRVGATPYYYFGHDYFLEYSKLGNKINFCVVEIDDQIASACIFTECCGIVQSYLSGTRNKFLKQSPDKLIFDYVRFWAKERGNEFLHLGGGLGSARDNLYNFKAGFSKFSNPFVTMRLNVDAEKYDYLVQLRAKALNSEPETLLKSNYFPAYRSPINN
ncbi:MAG: GNAT family N-acetyltransferase [Nostocaceae cyanobacterium]|nr:GNAT family N-acetyltransferase [Nostocaceae cyanobacterium]